MPLNGVRGQNDNKLKPYHKRQRAERTEKSLTVESNPDKTPGHMNKNSVL